MTAGEFVTRAVTIKLSRPDVFNNIMDARLDWYILGDIPPNYPVPATTDNGETSANWLSLHLCPLYYRQHNYVGPCRACIEKWEDQMLFDFPCLD